jgi:hypothetical protein
MLRNTSASNGLDSFTIQPKSEAYARTIQRLALLNSREYDFRLAPASRWLLEWGGFPCNAHSSIFAASGNVLEAENRVCVAALSSSGRKRSPLTRALPISN